jgi:quinolinate synthase
MYNSAPETYQQRSLDELRPVIEKHRARLGRKLVILTHHYQRKEVVRLGDFVGDSYYLARCAAEEKEAEYIVFCGVHFMAEAARVLCRDDQRVFLPNLYAGCPMADMAPIDAVTDAWEQVGGEGTIPISYMNSAASLKAFVGNHGGLICTSSNAEKAFVWGFQRGKRVFFFPDENLGYNTAHKMGIPDDEIFVYDPLRYQEKSPLPEHIRVVLWKGYCHVPTNFRPEHIVQMRGRFPGVKIVVHPECIPKVAQNADAVGSTSFIVNYVKDQPAGAIIAIGTELNLVSRLADDYPDKTVIELSGQSCSLCINMFRTTLADLAYTLDCLGQTNEILVDRSTQSSARLALERMLELN